MGRRIDFYFSMVSPWVYLGDKVFEALIAKHDLAVTYRPLPLLRLFDRTGGLRPADRPPARQAYRWQELQRWREARGVEMNLKPAHWPFPADLADRMIIAAQDAGKDPARFISIGLAGLWTADLDLADEAVLADLAASAGLDGAEPVTAAKEERIGAIYESNLEDAVAAGAFGSPTVVLDGEVFWGQDRYELLDAALTSGRAAYQAA
jgi:2-hydroxychromene-2-carboxylate isomerase